MLSINIFWCIDAHHQPFIRHTQPWGESLNNLNSRRVQTVIGQLCGGFQRYFHCHWLCDKSVSNGLWFGVREDIIWALINLNSITRAYSMAVSQSTTAYASKDPGNCLMPAELLQPRPSPLQWRHNERYGRFNHRRVDCLLNRLFRRRSRKKNNKAPRHCLLWEEITGPVARKVFPFDDVIMPGVVYIPRSKNHGVLLVCLHIWFIYKYIWCHLM